eukprot:TRINITY_DN78818_c0_g1_i1.p1 TRINITY_DN78818_c0_g1~~TRINITY_DN78818_c0_g1_i1.p1  ORF type:complete len:489 (+),score=60.25 TRINITY_DN78818_c0_g1_i1:50-1468(+)
MGFTDFICGTWDSLWRQQGFEACDGIRALSLLAVLTSHHYSLWGGKIYEIREKWTEQQSANAVWNLLITGEIGVDFFLVLSGFLIGGSMMNEIGKTHTIAWGKFYMRRLFRIVPAYFARILLDIVVEGRQSACLQVVWNILFINNFQPFVQPRCVPQSWSISVEMQLYLLTPPMFMLLACLKSKWPGLPSVSSGAMAVCVLLCFLSYALRVYFVFANPEPPVQWQWGQLYYYTQYRYSAYAAGVIVGVVVNGSADQTSKSVNAGAFENWAMLVVSLAGVAIVIASGGGDAQLEDVMYLGMQKHQKMDGFWYRLQVALERPLLDLAAASLTWLCVSGRVPCFSRFFEAKIWRPVAALSYSCYLLQDNISEVVGAPLYRLLRLGDTTSHVARIAILLVGPLVIFICTLPCGFILYSLVERPCILLGKRVISAMSTSMKPRDAPTERTVGEIEGSNDDVESQGGQSSSRDELETR